MVDYTKLKIPNHLAFIVDGNGRWALSKGKKRSEGHLAGFINLKKIIKYTYSKGIKYLSAYLFSTENFKRSEQEVSFIMGLLTSKLNDILDLCHEERIKVIFSGRKEKLSKKVLKVIDKIESDTSNYNTACLISKYQLQFYSSANTHVLYNAGNGNITE